MAGYQPFQIGRVSFGCGRPPMPVVDINLVRPPAPKPTAVEVRWPPEPLREKPIYITAPERERMRAMRREGKTVGEIAAAFGRSKFGTFSHIRDIPAPWGGWKTTGSKPTVDRSAIKNLRAEGVTFKEIARRLGCHTTTAYQALHGKTGRPYAKICRLVGDVTGVPYSDIRRQHEDRGRRTDATVAKARSIAFYLLHARMGLSYAEIGRRLGGFHHTSVMYGARRAEAVVAAMLGPIPDAERAAITRLWLTDWGTVP